MQMIVLAAVVGFLVGAAVTAVGCFRAHTRMAQRALEAEVLSAKNLQAACNFRAERDEALQSAADQARRANELTAQVRRMSQRE